MHQIIELCNLKGDAMKKVHAIIDKFADRGLRSLGIARQVVFTYKLQNNIELYIFNLISTPNIEFGYIYRKLVIFTCKNLLN